MLRLAAGGRSTSRLSIYELIMAFGWCGSSKRPLRPAEWGGKSAHTHIPLGRDVMLGRSPTVTEAAPDTAAFVPPMPRGATPHALPAGSLAQLAGHGAWLVATPKRRVFPGRPDQVAHARRF